jgi:hypothetical protein
MARSSEGAVVVLALLGACQSRAPSVERVEAAPSVDAAAAPRSAASGAASSSQPGRSNCGLATPERLGLMPVLQGRVVVQKGLGTVKLRGTPKLISEPEDFAEYYLGESAIDPGSLPAEVRAMQGAQLGVLRGPACRPRLGAFSALAWADEEGLGWSRSSPAKNAARVFAKGERFVVARLDLRGTDPDCSDFASGLVTLDRVDGYRDWHKVIEEYDRQDGSTRRPIFQQALATLPAAWFRSPLEHMYWTKASLADASVLILELRGDALPGSWLGVWCEEQDESLVSLGAVTVPAEHSRTVDSYRHHLWVKGRQGSLPLIFYAYFGLEASTGRYAFFNPSIGPAPHIEE